MNTNTHHSQNFTQSTAPHRIPIILSWIPLLILVFLLFIGIKTWEISAHIPLFFACIIATVIALYYKHSWKTLETGIIHSINESMQAILIMLIIGMLIGIWIISGIVPSIIYYGTQLIAPQIFPATSMIIASFVALASGSSWTTAGTIGIALVSTSNALGINPAITAGAVISGAYFGDKLSPLSDTTNLAPSISGSNLFDHIREMLPITITSYIISLLLFIAIGFTTESMSNLEYIATLQTVLSEQYVISLWLLLVPFLIIPIAYFRIPALPAISLLLLISALIALIQGISFGTIINTMHTGHNAVTNNEMINSLLSRGGLSSMMDTIGLILLALSFGGIMEKSGMLFNIMHALFASLRTTRSHIIASMATATTLNVTACDQYLAIALTGRMFRPSFEKQNIPPESLSNALETAGTVTSPLIPWNSCGAVMSGYLGIATITYLPFAFFNYLSPLIGIIFAIFNIFISKHALNNMQLRKK